MKCKIKHPGINALFLIAILFFLMPCALCLMPCYASFLDIGMGPRALGMGNAFTGIADDGYASYYNPAGLALIADQELNFSYASLYPGIDYLNNVGDGFLGYVSGYDPGIGGIGVSWINRHASDIYSENSYIISYARLLEEISKRLMVGVNVKILQLSYGSSAWGVDQSDNWSQGLSDPIFNTGNSAVGLSFDIGALFYISDKISVGCVVKDLNQPDIKLKDSNQIPLTAKVGAGYRINKEMTLLADLIYTDNDYRFNGGAEWWFKDLPFAIRAGLGIGSRHYLNFAAGTSYTFICKNLPEMQFDYAFLLPLNELEETVGSHRLGMKIKFVK